MMNFSIKQIISGFVLLLVTGFVQAHPAQDLIENSTRELMEILATEKDKLTSDSAYLQSVVDEKLLPHLDLNAMTALSLGKSWRVADAEQKAELIVEFRKLLLNTYMSALTLYTGQEMAFKPFLPQKRDDRAVVRAVFVQPSGQGVPVNYKLRQKDGLWRVYDIDVNNINLVSTYRSAFSQKVAKSGIEGLLDEMKAKNAAAEAAKAKVNG